MPNIWKKTVVTGRWDLQPLAGETCLVSSSDTGAQFMPLSASVGLRDIRLLPPDAACGAPSWTLLSGRNTDLRVNGQRLMLGIRALRDRDEISAAGNQWYFSTEELACLVPFPGLDQPACCPRCKQSLAVGDLAVACPHCHSWHHQSEKFSCWTYEPTCALCLLQSTALDAGYTWTPELI